MTKTKAVVMAQTGKFKNVLVYTTDGQYLTTRIQPAPPVGAMVYIKTPVLPVKPKILAVAAAVLLILFTGLMPHFFISPAAAYVNISLQPEIGLWLDREGKVTRVNMNGPEDDHFAAGLKGQNFYTALEGLLQYSQKQGYLTKDQEILMGTLIKLDDRDIPRVNEKLFKDFLCQQLERQGYQGAVVVTGQPEEMIQSAEKKGISLGQYVIYEKCQQQNKPVDLDLLRQENVSGALSRSGIEAKELFGHDYVEVHTQHNTDAAGDHHNPSAPMPNHGNIPEGSSMNPHRTMTQPATQTPADESDHTEMSPVKEHKGHREMDR